MRYICHFPFPDLPGGGKIKVIGCYRKFMLIKGKTSVAIKNKGDVVICQAMPGSVPNVFFERFEPDEVDQQFTSVFLFAELIRFAIRSLSVHFSTTRSDLEFLFKYFG